MIVGAVLELAGQVVKGLVDSRKQKRAISAAQAQRKIELIKDDKDRASDLDLYFAQNSSWMRNISFIVMFTPIIMAFVGFEEQVRRGFQALAVIPDEYMYAVGLMLVAMWGFRRMLQTLIQSRINKLIKEQ